MPIFPLPGGSPNARVTFDVILQAMEDQLIADGVVDPTMIAWGNADAGPRFTPPHNFFLIARGATHEGRDGGSGQLMMKRMVDVYIRTPAATGGPEIGPQDPAALQASIKAFMASQFLLADSIINSVGDDGWWPESSPDKFLLTIEPVKLVSDAAPARAATQSLFGNLVCTLSCLYFPYTDPRKGVFPIP